MRDETVPKKPKLLDELRTALRMKHYSYRTEQSYVYWARRFILFHEKKHPNTMGAPEVRAFCSHLAEAEHVSASTQNQAFNALVFLYKHVVGAELGVIDAARAKRPSRLPVVLSRSEVERVLSLLSGTPAIMATLLYGSGLRLMECHRLRVKDIDIEQRQIVVRDGKGSKDRVTMLPEAVVPELAKHLQRTKVLHRIFTERGYGEDREPGDDTTSMRARCSGRSNERFNSPESPNTPGATPFGTALRRICWNRAPTYEPSRSCCDTRMSERR